MSHIFISYSKKDIAFARHLRDLLQDEGFAVWMDETKLVPSQKWWPTIEQNILTCSAFIVIMSPNSKQSDWVEREILVAESLDVQKPIFPVLLAGRSWSRLGNIQHADMQDGENAVLPAALFEGLRSCVAAFTGSPVPPPLPEEEQEVPESPKPMAERGQRTLDEAETLSSEGRYAEAVILLEELRESGYRAKYVDLDTIILDTQKLRDGVLRREEAAREYRELATATRMAKGKAAEHRIREAWAQYCLDYPELVGELDAQDLTRRLAQVPPEQKPSFKLPLLEWISIPAGSVTLDGGTRTYAVEPFTISKYPITCAQFQAFIDGGGYHDDRWREGLAKRIRKPASAQWSMDTHPREMVTWYEAIAFCRWLSNKLGYTVTLPTEMQWQRAAQGDDGRTFPWGNDFDTTKCNTRESGIGQTTPVDHYPAGASPYGVMDMSGNVWEWCLNEYEQHGNTDVGGEAPRVVRGGSWYNSQNGAGIASRVSFSPGDRYDNLGFRVVAVPK